MRRTQWYSRRQLLSHRRWHPNCRPCRRGGIWSVCVEISVRTARDTKQENEKGKGLRSGRARVLQRKEKFAAALPERKWRGNKLGLVIPGMKFSKLRRLQYPVMPIPPPRIVGCLGEERRVEEKGQRMRVKRRWRKRNRKSGRSALFEEFVCEGRGGRTQTALSGDRCSTEGQEPRTTGKAQPPPLSREDWA